MKSRVLTLLLSVLFFACKTKDSVADIKSDLKNTMQTYLYNSVNNDSSKVKYLVEDIIYYDDKLRHKYVCEFTVHVKATVPDTTGNMKTKLFDTTGTMKADISEDLKKVTRYY